MVFQIFTLFPEMFPGSLGESLAGKALQKNLWQFQTVQIRDYAKDKYSTVDDTPYGGGAGMVMRADVISDAIAANPAPTKTRRIYPSPRGRMLDQKLAQELSTEEHITLLCGRYEGVDQRVLDAWAFEEISLGDYILSGGEMAALVLMDAVIRLIPGVLGNSATHQEESFGAGLLEYPHYTRPAEWIDPNGQIHKVPDILQSGHHGNIKSWRLAEAEAITQSRRPDLWATYKKQK